MLKTPKNPIWLTKINGLFGLVFSLNPDLVSDWRVENRFTMWYYTGLSTQVTPTMLSIGEAMVTLNPFNHNVRQRYE